MLKERIFRKDLKVKNVKIVSKEDLQKEDLQSGKTLKQEAELIAQVFYTPRGYSCELIYCSPVDTWDFDLFCRIEGISEEIPEGDLTEKHFDTTMAAMHFITRRLNRLGWDSLGKWFDG
jgi:hypothetical protein